MLVDQSILEDPLDKHLLQLFLFLGQRPIYVTGHNNNFSSIIFKIVSNTEPQNFDFYLNL